MADNMRPILGIAIKNNTIEGCSCSNGSSGTGKDGASAYQIAVMQGYTGTVDEWLMSLKGIDGKDGASAYQVAVMQGFAGTMTDWLLSLKGVDGKDGKDGRDGRDGKDGRDGINGKDGKDGKDGIDGKDGRDGVDGKSAYEIAVDNGFEGTEGEWLESLKGGSGNSSEVTKESIGLGNVDNTADADKSVLSATKLTTARDLRFSGAFTALGTFDGSKDIEIHVESVDATKLTGIIPWVNLPEITTSGSAQADLLETDESSPAFVKNKEAVIDIARPMVEDLTKNKVEFSGDIIPGAFVVADANGKLKCTTSVPSTGTGSTGTTVVAGVTTTIEVLVDGETSIAIPDGIDASNFALYLNGKLIVNSKHYNVDGNVVKLNSYAYAGDLLTFVGYKDSVANIDIGIATSMRPGLVKSSEGLNRIKVAEDGTMSIDKLDMSCLVTGSETTIILNGGSAI